MTKKSHKVSAVQISEVAKLNFFPGIQVRQTPSLSNNSVHQLDLNTNRLDTIWANDNNDGSTGLLDHPCETIIYKGTLIVVNFDTFTDEKNTEVDKFHTISKFKF